MAGVTRDPAKERGVLFCKKEPKNLLLFGRLPLIWAMRQMICRALSRMGLVITVLFCNIRMSCAEDFFDLSQVAPSSHDICGAIKKLRDKGREAEIIAHSLPESQSTSSSDPRSLMTPAAWAEASTGMYGMAHFLTNDFGATSFGVARVALADTGPKAWVLSTSIGSLRNPHSWIFKSAPDGSKPAHLIAQIGFEGSGPFDTYFVRFAGEPYAVQQFGGEKGSSFWVMQLDPGKLICSFSPR